MEDKPVQDEENPDAVTPAPDLGAVPVVPAAVTPAPQEPAISPQSNEAAAPAAAVPTETTASESVTTGQEEEETAPVTLASPEPVEAAESVTPTKSAEAALAVEIVGSDLPPHDATTPATASTQEPVVKEAQPRSEPPSGSAAGVVKEIEKPLTDQDRDQIFKDKLKSNLEHARSLKHAKFEAHLQEIVDFIRQKGTLVTNQDIEEGLKMPDTTVTDRLNELIRRAIVVRVGARRRAKYKLKEAL